MQGAVPRNEQLGPALPPLWALMALIL